jgi:hypothetical protein
MGGTGGHALYLFSYCNSKFSYLDPHQTRPPTTPTSNSLQSTYKQIGLKDMSTSMSFLMMYREEEVGAFWGDMKLLTGTCDCSFMVS